MPYLQENTTVTPDSARAYFAMEMETRRRRTAAINARRRAENPIDGFEPDEALQEIVDQINAKREPRAPLRWRYYRLRTCYQDKTKGPAWIVEQLQLYLTEYNPAAPEKFPGFLTDRPPKPPADKTAPTPDPGENGKRKVPTGDSLNPDTPAPKKAQHQDAEPEPEEPAQNPTRFRVQIVPLMQHLTEGAWKLLEEDLTTEMYSRDWDVSGFEAVTQQRRHVWIYDLDTAKQIVDFLERQEFGPEYFQIRATITQTKGAKVDDDTVIYRPAAAGGGGSVPFIATDRFVIRLVVPHNLRAANIMDLLQLVRKDNFIPTVGIMEPVGLDEEAARRMKNHAERPCRVVKLRCDVVTLEKLVGLAIKSAQKYHETDTQRARNFVRAGLNTLTANLSPRGAMAFLARVKGWAEPSSGHTGATSQGQNNQEQSANGQGPSGQQQSNNSDEQQPQQPDVEMPSVENLGVDVEAESGLGPDGFPKNMRDPLNLRQLSKPMTPRRNTAGPPFTQSQYNQSPFRTARNLQSELDETLASEALPGDDDQDLDMMTPVKGMPGETVHLERLLNSIKRMSMMDPTELTAADEERLLCCSEMHLEAMFQDAVDAEQDKEMTLEIERDIRRFRQVAEQFKKYAAEKENRAPQQMPLPLSGDEQPQQQQTTGAMNNNTRQLEPEKEKPKTGPTQSLITRFTMGKDKADDSDDDFESEGAAARGGYKARDFLKEVKKPAMKVGGKKNGKKPSRA